MGSMNGEDWIQCGRVFSAEEIKEIRETVAWLPGLARKEVAATVCEHLHWQTASGSAKIQACQNLPGNLRRVINNTRFPIFPHIQVPHLASHVPGQLARRMTADWQRHRGFTPLLLETFVDPARYAGTCYRAAGRELSGETGGRGLARPGKTSRSTPRPVLVKPLAEDFRQRLCTAPLPGRDVG